MRLSRKVIRNIHENLVWAFGYNIIGIPLAAGVFIPLFGWELAPMFGAAAMSVSSFLVVTNALRLNFAKIRNKKAAVAAETTEDVKEKTMKKLMKIEGMMCPHCSGRVKKALEETAGIAAAEVSHETGTADVTLSAEMTNEALAAIVEAQGYKVLSVE